MIRFNVMHLEGSELDYIQDALNCGRLAGDGEYTQKCSDLLKDYLGANSVLLTHSCTAALEMAALLADIQLGDEVIMPSYTFVSTANAFVLRGGIPVFVDIRADTLNIDERLISQAITPRTKAIVAVHYAGVSCEMDSIMTIAQEHNLLVIEDAAQALGSSYKGHKLGTIGDIGAFSFHDTKNIVSGEGGAIVINNTKFCERAEIIREKGTNRSSFYRGEVDKYTWVDIGSSYLPSELIAAFLFAQLQAIDKINSQRMSIWQEYNHAFQATAQQKILTLPSIPRDCTHNAHLFYLLTLTHQQQQELLESLKTAGINAVFHYVPLHNTTAGKHYARIGSTMNITEDLSNRLVRLPIYPNLIQGDINKICNVVNKFMQI